IAALDLTRTALSTLHMLTWNPAEPTATRPLALQISGTWFTYGLDLSKNVTELFNTAGGVETCYTYSPFGAVTEDGDTTSPIQWSSEFYDSELALVYYNYRHYNPADGRWINRDPIGIEGGLNLYGFVGNRVWVWDVLGFEIQKCQIEILWGHQGDVNDYIEDNHKKYDAGTCAFGPFGCHINPSPKGYEIPNFPDLQNSYLGDSKRATNAGYNKQGGTAKSRQKGFSKAYRKALQTAAKEAINICENTCCETVTIIFKGIGERSGSAGTKELRRRLGGAGYKWTNIANSNRTKEVNCKKYRKSEK
ncbi:MAG: RHS repeat-associated core domain-containing protein, partial [Rikenellaceae bacterium]